MAATTLARALWDQRSAVREESQALLCAPLLTPVLPGFVPAEAFKPETISGA